MIARQHVASREVVVLRLHPELGREAVAARLVDNVLNDERHAGPPLRGRRDLEEERRLVVARVHAPEALEQSRVNHAIEHRVASLGERENPRPAIVLQVGREQPIHSRAAVLWRCHLLLLLLLLLLLVRGQLQRLTAG